MHEEKKKEEGKLEERRWEETRRVRIPVSGLMSVSAIQ